MGLLKKFSEAKERRAEAARVKEGVGTIAADGSLYLGKHNGQYWYAAAEDAHDAKGARLGLSFNAAAGYAKALEAHGHQDWTLPDEKILQKMAESRNIGAFQGTYDTRGYYPQAVYWSSTEDNRSANKKNKKLNLGVVKFTTTYDDLTETRTKNILGIFTTETVYQYAKPSSSSALTKTIHYPQSEMYYLTGPNSPAYSVRCVRASQQKL